MLLFKPFHIEPIRNGLKTSTRRRWKRCRVRTGSIQRCQTALFTKDHFAKVRIRRTSQQPLNEMKDEDYRKEGGYTKQSFIDAWRRINGSYDPLEVVWVIEFENVEK